MILVAAAAGMTAELAQADSAEGERETAVEALPLPETVRFNRDVRTIFSNTCFACHGPDANTREAGLRLDLREEALRERDGVRPIVPGDAAASEAYRRIMADDPDEAMPPADFHTRLSPRDKAMLRKWIDQGADYETHWAFLAPQRPDPPQTPPSATAPASGNTRPPIDAFVGARLAGEGLAAAPAADRRTLIRRVTFDLTGLPPTAGEVEAFVADPAGDDDAYEAVVDRLLQSPRFGEHQARHWLDAARYADTSGYQYDSLRTQWVWRDWVIDAFNTNMPFDQFTLAQNAGDLLPEPSAQSRLATGFHRNHPITIEGGVIDEEYRTEYVMDRVVTTTTAWLGLTFVCARCHDHKYDPISQDDFYSFFAFFNNVPERGLNGFDPKERITSPLQQAQLAGLEAKAAAAVRQLGAALEAAAADAAGWERALRDASDADLKPAAVTTLAADGGTELARLEDGSILATGPNPDTQTYQVELVAGDSPVTALRLEALPHASLAQQSTGRAFNGNFVLSEIVIEARAAGATDGADGAEWTPSRITSAEADYEQRGYPVSAAIDGASDDRGGWAVDGNTRFEASTATFTLAEPLAPMSQVRVRLVHHFGTSHAIGRFRVSLHGSDLAPLPAALRDTLATARGERTEAAQAALDRYLARRFGSPETAAIAGTIEELEARLATARAEAPETMVLKEMPEPRQTFVLMRGEYDKPMRDRLVAPNVPGFLGGLADSLPRNRLGLARWLVSRDNPLTARVTVNRFWAQLFGTGIVKTIEDFGSQGEFPSHPDLLDWLATEFVDSGWNVKHLFKTMVMSGTYRQDSRVTAELRGRDPDNRLLARGPRFRLDAEAIRDAALAAGGLLDPTIGGESVYPYHPQGLWLEINNRPGYSRAYPHSTEPAQLYRRSLYTFWKRTVPPPGLATFDAPEREYCVVQRSRTNTPLQAFVLLHDPQFVEAARKLAERMIREADATSPAQRIAHGFLLCTARHPTGHEAALLGRALKERLAQYRADPEAAARLLAVGQSPQDATIDPAELAAYTTIARMLLNLSESIT